MRDQERPHPTKLEDAVQNSYRPDAEEGSRDAEKDEGDNGDMAADKLETKRVSEVLGSMLEREGAVDLVSRISIVEGFFGQLLKRMADEFVETFERMAADYCTRDTQAEKITGDASTVVGDEAGSWEGANIAGGEEDHEEIEDGYVRLSSRQLEVEFHHHVRDLRRLSLREESEESDRSWSLCGSSGSGSSTFSTCSEERG